MPIDRYVVDLACLEARLVVEIDGATHSTETEIARDEERCRDLERCGFAILRVANATIFENGNGVRETILAALERRDRV